LGKPDDNEGENTTLAFDFLKSNDTLSRDEVMEARSQLFKSLLSFKKQLAQAEQITHRNNELVKEAERKRKAAQEEVFYLNSVVSQLSSKDPSLYREISDRQALKKKLDESEDIINNLRTKLNSWTKASKRNLEARHVAETCTKTMEGELQTYKKAFEEVKAREDAYESRVQELEATILTSGLSIPPDTNQLPTGNEERKNQILQIKELEKKCREAQEELLEWKMMNSNIQKELASNRMENERLDASLNECRNTISKYENDIKESEEKIKEAENAREKMEKAKDDLEHELFKNSEELKNQTEVLMKCQKELEETKLTNQVFRDQLQKKTSEVDSLNQKLEESLKVQDLQNQSREKSNEQINNLRSELERSKESVSSIQQQLSNVEQIKNQTEEELTMKLNKMEEHILSLQGNVEDKDNLIYQLEEKIKENGEQILSLQEEKNNVKWNSHKIK